MQKAQLTESCLLFCKVASYAKWAKLFTLVISAFLLNVGIENSSAQPVYSQGIVGCWNCVFMPGTNLFNAPFVLGNSNGLNEIFPPFPDPLPEGTTVSLWNPNTLSFDTTSTFSSGSWSINLTLPPGTGALLVTPLPSTNVVAGIVQGHNGSISVITLLNPPPLFTGPNGTYLLGDKLPIADIGTNIFINILGRFPFVGEQVTTLSGTSTYLGNGQWDSVPTLGVAQAAFLNIKSVPPPVLTIQNNNNQAVISWPSSENNWTLQTNNDLAAGVWGNYTGSVVNNTVTNSPLTRNLFFRLSYP